MAENDDPLEEFRVYKPWPEEVVMTELRVFKDHMYDGAGPDELEAGLRCLDFLTRGSILSDVCMMLVEAAQGEAVMRIKLMLEKEVADLTDQERSERLKKVVDNLHRGLINMQTQMIKWGSHAEDKLREKYGMPYDDYPEQDEELEDELTCG